MLNREKRQRYYVLRHQRLKKLKYVKLLGGCCSKPGCGYHKNLAALDFHHPNGNDHECENWRSPKFKIEECVLLCSNCHREEHNPDLNDYRGDDLVDEKRSRAIKEGLRKASIVNPLKTTCA